jgi:hypothetical protein
VARRRARHEVEHHADLHHISHPKVHTKKLENESVVSRQTALVLTNLDGRHSPLTTQGTDRYRKETQGTEVGTQVLAKAAVRTTWVESPVHLP